MASFPGGLPIRRAGPMPIEPVQEDVFSDVGQGLRQTAGDLTRHQQMQEMIRKRQLANEIAARKSEYEQREFELREAEHLARQEKAERDKTLFDQKQEIEKEERARKETFFKNVARIPPDAPNRKELIEQYLFQYQQLDPSEIYKTQFGGGRTQGPAAQVMFDQKGHPWQLSRSEGRTTLLPYTVPGGGPTPTKFVPPKAGQTITHEDLGTFTLQPGETVAKPVTTPGGEQLRKPIVSSQTKQKAKSKLVTLKLARKQLKNIEDKFLGGLSFGAWGQGYLPTKEGKQFDAAVNAIRQTFRQLTRTPGEGAMSDFETRLASAAIPSRTEYEDVTREQIRYIKELLDTLDAGYLDMIKGRERPQIQPRQKITAENIDAALDEMFKDK